MEDLLHDYLYEAAVGEPTIAQHLSISVPSASLDVSAVLCEAPEARAFCVLAHGAGAGMRNRAMEEIAVSLAAVGISTLRYNFPYMERAERGMKQVGQRYSKPELLATVRAAVAAGAAYAEGLPLLAGGKSMGGRMTSLAAAEMPLRGVRGIVFYGFPLHPDGKPGTERADHLAQAGVPMLFLQGTRDGLATPELLRPIVGSLGDKATLYEIEGADHSFKAPGKKDVFTELAMTVSNWVDGLRE